MKFFALGFFFLVFLLCAIFNLSEQYYPLPGFGRRFNLAHLLDSKLKLYSHQVLDHFPASYTRSPIFLTASVNSFTNLWCIKFLTIWNYFSTLLDCFSLLAVKHCFFGCCFNSLTSLMCLTIFSVPANSNF